MMVMNRGGLDWIAELAHEACRTHCETQGDPPLPPWAKAPEWMKASVHDGIAMLVLFPNHGPAESHANWRSARELGGWVLGPVKDAVRKTHPNLVPFDQLPIAQQVKDTIFVALVRALLPYVNQVERRVVPRDVLPF